MAGGLPPDRVLRVQGLADSVPFDRQDPRAPTNRRISIIVMNREAEDRFFRVDPEVVADQAAAAAPEVSIKPELAPLASPTTGSSRPPVNR